MEPEGGENPWRFAVVEEETDDDINNDDCDLDDDQLFQCTQAYSSQYYDFEEEDENDDDYDPDAPKPIIIDFSQTEANDDSNERSGDVDNNENSTNETTPPQKKQRLSAPNVLKDTPDKYYLDVDGVSRIFKIGEVFHKEKSKVDLPAMVYKIERLYKDSKTLKKKAQCKVYMLARNTFMGKQVEFENKYGKYVFKKMGEMVNLASLKTRVDDKEFLHKIDKTQVFIDPPSKDNKGAGWTVAYGFIKTAEEKATYKWNDKPTFMDLYAGAGGVSIGFKEAGFRLTHAVDNDPMAARTLDLNHRDGPVIVFIEKVGSYAARCRSSNCSDHFKDAPDHIHGSSPCKGFSTKNRNGGKNDEENNEQSLVWVRCVIDKKANTGSFENVTGMILKKSVHYLQTMINLFLMARYQIRIGVVNCADYGDPQNRKRVLVLVSRTPCPLPGLPKKTHAAHDYVTARDAIGDLEYVNALTEPGMTLLPGENIFVNHHYNPAKQPSREDFLEADKPANTILCKKEVKHYSFDRNITNLERARLFNFPDSWKFCGRPTDIMKQIGNAVPIGTSTAIGKCIKECYEAAPDYFGDSSEEQSTSTEPPPIPANRPFRGNNARRVTNNFET